MSSSATDIVCAPTTDLEVTFRNYGNIPLTTLNIIYDINGRKIKQLISGFMSSGGYTITWDGKDKYGHDVPSGIYIYQLLTTNRSLSNKMILLR